MLACPDTAAEEYSYGNIQANRYLTHYDSTAIYVVFNAAEQLISYIGSLVVESNTRVRAVTGSVNEWFRLVNDGLNEAANYAIPEKCQSVHGAAGWYYIGKVSSGVVGTDYHTIWVCNDDGASGVASWSGASGADPQNNSDGESLPYNLDGVRHIAIIRTVTTIAGSAPSMAL
jgi:hypothetical protein